ncbi:MAG: transcriptional repressor [Actinomycetota bacterium]|nr:transcriptional repressor [Actinomycetota bacterium]
MLRGAGLRVTRPRTAVLHALEERPHSGADAILADVRRTAGPVSHQAVYDVLNTLTAAALLRRIQPAGSVARYELRVGDNHHHLVCRECGVVVDVDCATGEAPCLEAAGLESSPDPEQPSRSPQSDGHGFVVDEAEVTWWGRCPTCQQTQQPNDQPGDQPTAQLSHQPSPESEQ